MAIRMSGMASGLDTESIVKELMSAQRLKSTKITNKKTKLEWQQDKWKDLNAKIYALYTGDLAKIRMQGSYNTRQATSSDESKVTATASNSVPEGKHSITVTSVASAQYITGNKLATEADYSTSFADLNMDFVSDSSITISAGTNSVDFEVTEDKTIGDFVSALQEAGLNASFDITSQRFFISSKKSGIDNAFEIKTSSGTVDYAKLGLSEVTKVVDEENGTAEITVGTGVSKVEPADSIIIYNGAKIRDSSSNIAVNGLSLTLNGKTDIGQTVNISVTRDTQAVYEMVKTFIKSYNEVLKAMNEAYNADTAKGYDPLTDEEKEAMTEDQIKKWEDKIKSSLLRRDTTLGSLINTIRTDLSQSVNVNGKNYSLASFGITSVNYTEKGLLHINGDKDDSLSATAADKLMKAITENPDAVVGVISKLANNLYSSLNDKMKSTTLSSALTVYNDKEMKKTVTDYEEQLSAMEKRLQNLEARYYKQFTAMEKAMSNLNSQSSYLSSLLGTGNS